MMGFLRDLRYALRSLGRTPALTAALLATVAVGIGAHATVTGFVNGLLTRNLALPDTADLAAVHWRDAAGVYAPVPLERFAALRDAPHAFAALAAFRESRAPVTLDGRTSWMSVAAASPDLWRVLALPAALGRASFDAGDEPAAPAPVVIGHKLWKDGFSGSAEAIGAELQVGRRRCRVAGVAPEWFEGIYLGRAIDVWLPLDDAAPATGATAVWVLGRLAPGSSHGDAEAQVNRGGGTGGGFVVMPHSGIEPDVHARFARVKALLGWAAALVFVTAAANVAGFLLSRASRRAHETAARVALGATRAHLVSQILAESLVVTAGGAVLGGLVAFWTASVLPALLYAEDAARLHLMPDAWQVARSVAAYAAVMLLCALAPAAQINQHGPMTVLRRSEGTASTSVGRLRSALVVAQMGVCVILVIATALLFEGFRQALRTIRAENLGQPVVAVLEASGGYARPAAGEDYFRRAEDAVARAPGVIGTAWVGTLPGGRNAGLSVRLEQPRSGSKEAAIPAVTLPGAKLLELTLVAGRPFGGQDGPFSCRVALVNGEANAEYFGGGAVGRSIEDSAGRRIDIIGLVTPRRPRAGESSGPLVYFYERQALTPPSPEVRLERLRLPIPPATPPPVDVEIAMNVASTGYFEAIGASFPSGGAFGSGAVSGACDVAVVNREAAELYFGGRAVGGAVVDAQGRRAEIVGVVDAGVLHVMQRRAEPMVFFPAAQRYIPRMALIAATRKAEQSVLDGITQRLAAVPGGAGGRAITLEEHLSRTSLGPERIATVLVAAAAAMALALGLLGAYGVMSDAVRQKKREIALRLALGAQAWKIVYDVFRSGVRVAVAGAGCGLLVSWLLVRLVLHANPGFAAPALWMWLVSPLALLAVVTVASVLPARWALAVDPLTITRQS